MQRINRRDFLKAGLLSASSTGLLSPLVGCQKSSVAAKVPANRPNIILVITDDQGYGDVGLHGNPHLKTPAIDAFAKEGCQFRHFYVSPVCAPTRASLMTGRYNYRTGVVDTYLGRAMMHPDEITLAEALQTSGYATALFGKWHLGDNTPLRPQEQGFDEVLMHLGGGLGQPSDPPGGSRYTDPLLFHNGIPKRYKGYCMDIYTDAAIAFAQKHRRQPFFIYLATNTPHTPLEIDDAYVEPFRKMGLTENTARVYGMIRNIDDNFGRLLNALDQTGLSENTIVIFMGDNGPCLSSVESDRYMAGLRGSKGTVYENGIRVPFFIRWPKGFGAGRTIDTIAAHIDLMPTLLDACGIDLPSDRVIDGVSLMPLLTQKNPPWPNRTLFFQWHRGDAPERYRAFSARNQKYKLVQAKGWKTSIFSKDYEYELFDLDNDPGETHNIAAKYPELVEQMKAEYSRWFDEVVTARTLTPPRIEVGSARENPITLSRQDWRGAAGWEDSDVGVWETQVVQNAKYRFKVQFSQPVAQRGMVCMRLNQQKIHAPILKEKDEVIFEPIELTVGPLQISAWLEANGKQVSGARYIQISR